MSDTAVPPPIVSDVADAEQAHAVGADYVTAVGKVIASHVRNELAGAAVFDEPAIAMAPDPHGKWLACRIAMEEYGHHLKFKKLAMELGLEARPDGQALSVFEFELRSWTEFVVLKAVVDLAEVILMEELVDTSYLPLRGLVSKLLPEERFHVAFGRAQTKELAARPETRPEVQQAVFDLVPFTLPFFGRSVSANNELFRRWGVKTRTNDEARAEFVRRSTAFVVDELALDHPHVEVTWNG